MKILMRLIGIFIILFSTQGVYAAVEVQAGSITSNAGPQPSGGTSPGTQISYFQNNPGDCSNPSSSQCPAGKKYGSVTFSCKLAGNNNEKGVPPQAILSNGKNFGSGTTLIGLQKGNNGPYTWDLIQDSSNDGDGNIRVTFLSGGTNLTVDCSGTWTPAS